MRCSYSQNNKDCGSTATRLEGTNHPLCTDHYEIYMDEINSRTKGFYRTMKQWPHLIEITPEVDWGMDWYINDETLKYALIEILPATREKKDL